jgi:hypothetical protein
MKKHDEFIEVKIGLNISIPLVIIITFHENTFSKEVKKREINREINRRGRKERAPNSRNNCLHKSCRMCRFHFWRAC